MHKQPKMWDIIATADGPNCINIEIHEELIIEKAHIKVLGQNRNLLLSSNITERNIKFCVETGTPTFVELSTCCGTVVTYVKGSGYEAYKLN